MHRIDNDTLVMTLFLVHQKFYITPSLGKYLISIVKLERFFKYTPNCEYMFDGEGRNESRGGNLGRRRMLQLSGVSTLGTLFIGSAAGEEDDEVGTEASHQVTVTGPDQVEIGSTREYQAGGYQGSGNYGYFWSVEGDGSISEDGDTAEVTFDSQGWYTVSVTVADLEHGEILGGDDMDVLAGEEPSPVEVTLYGRDELIVDQETEITASPDADDVDIEYDWTVTDAVPLEYDIEEKDETAFVTFHTDGEFTLQIDYETEEGYQSEATMEFLVVDVQPYIDQKAGTIDQIRNLVTARTHIEESEADARVDQRAEALLEDIKNGAFDAGPDQYEEALKRMNAAEEVTSTTTEAVVGDGSIFRDIIDAIWDATTGGAIELALFFIPGSGALTKLNKSILKDIARYGNRMAETLSGPTGPASQIGRVISQAKEFKTDQIKMWADNNPGEVDDAAHTLTEEGLVDLNLQVQNMNIIDMLDDGKDDLAEAYFEWYYFDPSDLIEMAERVPLPGTWDLPMKEVLFEFPVDDLPPEYRIILDEILDRVLPDDGPFQIDPEDFGLYTPQEVENLADMVEQIAGEAVGEDVAVNSQIDNRMEDIRAEIGTLHETNDVLRDLVTFRFTNGIRDLDLVADQCLDALDTIESVFTGLSIGFALFSLGLVLLGVMSAKTGGGAILGLSIGAVLGLLATAFSVMSVFTNLLYAKGGIAYLAVLPDLHYIGTYGLTRTPLGGVDP